MNLLIPRHIILHCSATADRDTFSWGDIRRYHIEERGWSDIGYHFGIEAYKGDFVILQGRDPLTMGAHCKASGRNHDSLGVCVVGNFDYYGPTPTLYRYTAKTLAMLCFMFGVQPHNIFGHREFESQKTCPGLRWDLDALRLDVSSLFHTDDIVGYYMPLPDIYGG